MTPMEEWQDRFGGDEELDPELAECIVTMGRREMQFVKHPLVNTLYMGVENKHLNRQLAYKREAIAEARQQGEWHSFIWLHERPWRLEALMDISLDMSDQEFWSLVANVWMDSENIRENYEAWDRLLRLDRSGQHHLMDDKDREGFAAIPVRGGWVTIWQGHTTERDDGWSWTMSREKAVWFARRFALMEGGQAVLTKGRIRKSRILAYFAGRGEEEVLAAPEHVFHSSQEFV